MNFSELYEGVALKTSSIDDKARDAARIVCGAPNCAAVPSSAILAVWAKAVEQVEDFPPVPSAQTLNGYLNRALELGLIIKPTRQTYAAAPVATEQSDPAGDVEDTEQSLADELGLAS